MSPKAAPDGPRRPVVKLYLGTMTAPPLGRIGRPITVQFPVVEDHRLRHLSLVGSCIARAIRENA